MEIKQWLSENANRKLTDQDIANLLNITRKTANKRLNEGLDSDDLLELCEKLGVNRTLALVELGKLPHDDVIEYLNSGGELLATASDGDVALELARRLNPATKAPIIDELAARRDVPFHLPEGAVADSSPDEDG